MLIEMYPLAVIDVETTGLNPYRHDRIVEVAVVLIQPGVGIIEEFTTLVNPERDVGPTRIHGITASDVIYAPRFAQVAGNLIEILSKSKALVGHNVRFDHAFLRSEFAKAGYEMPECILIDTLSLAGGGKLEFCCAKYGVQFDGRMHSALHDARATAGLFQKILDVYPEALPDLESFENVDWPKIMTGPNRLLPRDMLEKTCFNSSVHLPEVAAAQWIEPGTQLNELNGSWMGKTVCFTGESQCAIGGRMITRGVAETIAAEKGLVIQSYVTRKLDFLIAADPNTQSTKAKKARQYGTRIIHELVFWRALGILVD